MDGRHPAPFGFRSLLVMQDFAPIHSSCPLWAEMDRYGLECLIMDGRWIMMIMGHLWMIVHDGFYSV